jgi:preprotein translocase subunit SecB
MLSPLQLRQHSFTEVSLVAIEDGSADAEVTFEQQVQCGSKADNPLIWRADLQIIISCDKDKPFNYSGSIAVRGIFEIHPGFPENRREELIRVTGASILYGAVREMILNITSRSLKGAFLVPTVSFVEAQRGKQQVRSKRKSTKPVRTRP